MIRDKRYIGMVDSNFKIIIGKSLEYVIIIKKATRIREVKLA